MNIFLIASCAIALIAVAGEADALANTAHRPVPGASMGRHYLPHRASPHPYRHVVRRKPVVPPSQ